MVSVFITSYNDSFYLNKILDDLDRQDFGNFEILLLEAGQNQEEEAKQALKCRSHSLKYFHQPGASRTHALNQLVGKASGDLLVRLDARTHIKADYIRKVVELSKQTGAVNVGGIMWPIGESEEQKIIAQLMKSPYVFGGARFRKLDFKGEAETVYLGAFRKSDVPFLEWYDSMHPKMSEDSDLNYRLRLLGKKVIIDSSIIAYHYPRESLAKFFRLCFNYGVGRGLFLFKHKSLLAPRQFLFVACALVFLGVGVAALLNPLFIGMFLCMAVVYGASALVLGLSQKTSLGHKFEFSVGLIGAHLCWFGGLLSSPVQYLKDLRMQDSIGNP